MVCVQDLELMITWALTFGSLFIWTLLRRIIISRHSCYIRTVYWVNNDKRHKVIFAFVIPFWIGLMATISFITTRPDNIFGWSCLFLAAILNFKDVSMKLAMLIRNHKLFIIAVEAILCFSGVKYPALLAPLVSLDLIESFGYFCLPEDEFTKFSTKYPYLSNDNSQNGKPNRAHRLWKWILHKTVPYHRQETTPGPENMPKTTQSRSTDI